jgi:glucose-1-phosphate cytidylyltransferase
MASTALDQPPAGLAMKVLILCGGEGVWAYPHKHLIPRAMLPVAGLPAVEQLMRTYAAHGFDDFVLAVGRHKQHLVEYFNRRPEWRVEYVDTGDRADSGTRIRRCLHLLGARFHVTYADCLGDVDLDALGVFHLAHGDGATVTTVPLRSQHWVLVSDHDDRVTQLVAKPTLAEHWINAGYFVFDRDALLYAPGDNLESDILPQLVQAQKLRAYRHRGFWRRLDTPKDRLELESLWVAHSRDLDAKRLASGAALPGWRGRRQRLPETSLS